MTATLSRISGSFLRPALMRPVSWRCPRPLTTTSCSSPPSLTSLFPGPSSDASSTSVPVWFTRVAFPRLHTWPQQGHGAAVRAPWNLTSSLKIFLFKTSSPEFSNLQTQKVEAKMRSNRVKSGEFLITGPDYSVHRGLFGICRLETKRGNHYGIVPQTKVWL